MIPTSFEGENCVLDPPKGMSLDDCEVLNVFRGVGHNNNIPIVISCWKPDKAELEEIIKTGRVWLVIMGNTMPPAFLSGISPFKLSKII